MIPATLLDAALDYAEQGWQVLPGIERGPKAKAPYLTHGFHDATNDPDTIRAWWTRWPSAMIGAVVPSALLVLDVDPRNGGSADALTRMLGPMPSTLTAVSGRGDGGQHYYYRRPVGRLTARRLPARIDLKTSGYVIVPPSVHPATGLPYQWESLSTPVASLPGTALAALRASLPTARLDTTTSREPLSFHGLASHVAAACEGNRNAFLHWAACRAVSENAPPQVFDDLANAAATAGLDQREITATIASAHRTVEGAR